MSMNLVGSLTYIGNNEKMGDVVTQVPFEGYDGFIKKVKTILNSDDFVEFKPSLEEQIERNF